MPFITLDKYDDPCSDLSEDNRTDALNEFGDIDSSKTDSIARIEAARLAKAPKPMPQYQNLVHGPNYYGLRLLTPADGSLDNPTLPLSKQKKTSQKASMRLASESPVPKSPGTKAQSQSTKSR